jgi:hypothetical protein
MGAGSFRWENIEHETRMGFQVLEVWAREVGAWRWVTREGGWGQEIAFSSLGIVFFFHEQKIGLLDGESQL